MKKFVFVIGSTDDYLSMGDLKTQYLWDENFPMGNASVFEVELSESCEVTGYQDLETLAWTIAMGEAMLSGWCLDGTHSFVQEISSEDNEVHNLPRTSNPTSQKRKSAMGHHINDEVVVRGQDGLWKRGKIVEIFRVESPITSSFENHYNFHAKIVTGNVTEIHPLENLERDT